VRSALETIWIRGREKKLWKAAVSLLMIACMVFTTVGQPLVAGAAQNKAAAVKKLVNHLTQIISGNETYAEASDEQQEGSLQEESSKEESLKDGSDVPDTSPETSPETPAISEEEPTEASEQAGMDSSDINQTITIVTAEETQVFTLDGNLNVVSETSAPTEVLTTAAGADAAEIDWSDYSIDELVAAATEILQNDNQTCKSVGQAPNVYVIYGGSNYSVCKDEDLDAICDDCGGCLNGCTDGTAKQYTETDIDESRTTLYHTTEDGKNLYTYFNSDGVQIGQDVYIKNKILVTDPNGTETEEDSVSVTISFETYYIGSDGKCDVCGSTMCRQHAFGNGKCDFCGHCMSGCECTAEEPGDDPVCDKCGFCINSCKDENGDGTCDLCSKPYHLVHCDRLGGDECSSCGASYCSHMQLTEIQELAEQLQEIASALQEKAEAATDEAQKGKALLWESYLQDFTLEKALNPEAGYSSITETLEMADAKTIGYVLE